jgi:hypothetical protein
MPDTVMPPIEELGKYSIQLPHAFREVAVGSLYDQVVVVVHETVGVAEPVEPLVDLMKYFKKGLSVLVVLIDSLPGIAAGSDMIDGPVVFYAQRPSHTPSLA